MLSTLVIFGVRIKFSHIVSTTILICYTFSFATPVSWPQCGPALWTPLLHLHGSSRPEHISSAHWTFRNILYFIVTAYIHV